MRGSGVFRGCAEGNLHLQDGGTGDLGERSGKPGIEIERSDSDVESVTGGWE